MCLGVAVISSITAEQGASVGLLLKGLRIFDQLGIYEAIEKQASPLQKWRHLDGDGNLIVSVKALGFIKTSETRSITEAESRETDFDRLGYGALFLERTRVLQSMYDRLQNKDNRRSSTRATSIPLDHGNDGVVIRFSEDESVLADIVIGADGVQSCIRHKINQIVNSLNKGVKPTCGHQGQGCPAAKVQKSDCHADLSTRFSCVYGISTPLSRINEGDCFSAYRKNSSILIFTGKGGVIFCCVFQDLGQTFPFESTPRYAPEDVESACQNVASLRVLKTISFGDIYARRTVTKRTALEEGLADNWHHGRMVIVGDAAHKVRRGIDRFVDLKPASM
jgi:FAD dependent monooxygenase